MRTDGDIPNALRLRWSATLALVLLLVAGVCCCSSTASAESVAVLHGGTTSHLRITYEAGTVHVQGNLARTEVAGECGHECSLAGVDRLEILTGPGPDKVEILDPLPVPVTVRLGAGSDKFIGNDEQDTCFSEGARRNRCIGGAGDDVCVTGDRNSDCVGGPGDDLCVHGNGSDGCWGGPGDDICRMGGGEDGCHGGAGDDRLFGGSDADQLYGGPGSDYCDGEAAHGRSTGCERGPRH